jgi:hypothetical protein
LPVAWLVPVLWEHLAIVKIPPTSICCCILNQPDGPWNSYGVTMPTDVNMWRPPLIVSFKSPVSPRIRRQVTLLPVLISRGPIPLYRTRCNLSDCRSWGTRPPSPNQCDDDVTLKHHTIVVDIVALCFLRSQQQPRRQQGHER